MTRGRFTLDLARRTGADTVWVRAHWYTARGQAGESSPPVGVNLPAATSLPMAEAA